MRTTKTLSITLPPQMLRDATRLAKKENRTMSELVREALRTYQKEQQKEQFRQQQIARLRSLLDETRTQAAASSRGRLSVAAIDAEIAAYRRERRSKKVLKQLVK